MVVSAVMLKDIKRPTKFLDLRTDKDHVVGLGKDGLVRIWKLDNQDLSQPTILVQAKNSTALALHIPYVVIGLASGDLHLWNTRSAVFKTLTTGMSDFIDDIYITTIGNETYICTTAGDELAVIKGQDDQYTPGIIIRPFDRPGLVLRNTLSTYQGHIRLIVTGVERQSDESQLSIAHVTWKPDDFFGTMKCTSVPGGDGDSSGRVQAVLDMKDSSHILIQCPKAEVALLDGNSGQVKWRMLASTEPENVVVGQGCFTQCGDRQLSQ